MLKIKRNIFVLILLSLKVCTVSGQVKKILFIGNSITYFNNMPQVFRDIANEKGDSVDLTMYAPGSTGFQHHVIDNNVYSLLRNKVWDVVVLQPGSNESPAYSQPRDLTLLQGRKMIDSVLHYSPCARVMFYEISYGVVGTSPQNIVTYNNVMDQIRLTSEYLSDSTGFSFAPGGECLRHVWNKNPALLLWGSAGDIHPNVRGSYLVSCAFYASIFHKPSFGSTVLNGNSLQDAQYYQHVSDSIVLNHSALWRIDTSWHRAKFNAVLNGQTLDVTNTSIAADSIRWFLNTDFSGTNNQIQISNLPEGSHELTQVAYFGTCSDTLSKVIQVTALGLTDEYRITIQWYPNPAQKTIFINQENVTVRIYSMTGDLLIEEENKQIVSLEVLSKGIYILELESAGSVKLLNRLIKE
ncbi:hypothetical protein D3C71_770160 [compost metagenome]